MWWRRVSIMPNWSLNALNKPRTFCTARTPSEFSRAVKEKATNSVTEASPTTILASTPTAAVASSNSAYWGLTAQERLSARWNFEVTRYVGDNLQKPTLSGRYFFATLAVFQLGFAGFIATDSNPDALQRTIDYHLPFSTLLLAFWGGSYAGAEAARFGVGSSFYSLIGRGKRTFVGSMFLFTSAALLAYGMYEPWKAYDLTAASFPLLALTDFIYSKAGMAPSHFLTLRLASHAVAMLSCIGARVRGSYMAENADLIVDQAALDATMMTDTGDLVLPSWLTKSLIVK